MILGVRYDKAAESLEVIFRTGEKYCYKNVPRSVYKGLINAKSQGQYMHKNILRRYDFERM